MKSIKNLLKVLLLLTVSIIITGTIICTKYSITPEIFKIEKTKHLAGSTLQTGEFISPSGHKVIKTTEGTLLYDDTYTLTLKSNVSGNTISGNIGSNSKSITLYQLNKSTIVTRGEVTYLHNSETHVLPSYSVFKANSEVTPVEDGIIELWRNNQKINTYATLQDAVDSANENDTIKLNKDYSATEGVYIKKSIILDGNNYTIDKSALANSLMYIEENVNFTIKNLIIDGGASGFKVNYEGITYTDYTIPLVSGSDKTDPKQTQPPVISKGNLMAENIKINNNYVNGHGGALQIVSGSATLKNSEFNHNRANNGGALYIYSTFKTGEKTYPIKNVTFENCNFKNNYSSSAGAIYAANLESINIKNCNFINNVANKGYGGAISVARNTVTIDGVQYNSQGHAYGLDFIQTTIDNSLFEANYSGKDGSAIINGEGELYVSNTIFRKNIGVNSEFSSGTITCHVFRHNMWADQIIKNCTFEENNGKVSCFADYGSKVFVGIHDTKFTKNSGDNALLYQTGYSEINNASFVEDQSTEATVGINISSTEEYYEDCVVKQPQTKITNTTFVNSKTNNEIVVESAIEDETIAKAQVELTGTTKANISVADDNKLTISGTLLGQVTVDSSSKEDSVTIKESANLIGEVVKTNITINYYPTSSSTETEVKKVYIEKNTKVTPEYIRNILNISENAATIKVYTDENLTNEWDYIVTDNLILYTNWQSHTHTKQVNLSVQQSGIYYSCECGYLYEGINLSPPKNIIFDGTPKEVIITNTLNINETDYKITYKVKKNNDSWITINGSPIEPGEYKAELSYNDLTTELKYKIYDAVKNPVTSPTKYSYILILITLLSTFIIVYITQKKTNKIKVGN